MSTVTSSNEHLTFNADGSGKNILFQANGTQKASISSAGLFTSTTIDATALTGNLPAISGANLTGVGVDGIVSTANATAITIDSSESVGIDNSTGFGNYSGTGVKYAKGDGTFFIGRAGGIPLFINRETNQGDMIVFNASGTSLVKLGTDSGGFTVGTGTGGNTERMRIDASGNVTSISKLTINNTTVQGALVGVYTGAFNDAGVVAESGIHLANNTAANTVMQMTFGLQGSQTKASGYIGFKNTDVSGLTKGALIFGTRDVVTDTTPTERVRITSAGKVGIGHTSPPSQLTIQGGVEYRTAPAPGSGTLDIRDTGAEGGAGPVGNHGGGIVLGVTAGKGFCGIKAGLGDGGGNTAGHMKFYTRGATGDTHMSERMRIEYNGRVQINGVQASPASGGNLVVESNSGNGAAMTLVGDSNATAGFGNKVVALNFSAKNYLAYNNPGVWAQIRAENGNGSYSDRGQLVFSTGYGGSTINDHMILYSEGHLTLGHASNAAASQGSSSELTFYNNGNFYTISNNSRISASSERQTFRSAGTQVGAISAGGSSTSYGTSSDYRLKENVDYTWDATTRLKQLKPARFNWISDDTNTLVDGFIAHEAADVVPDSVFGIKDAMAPETYYVDGDELPAGKAIGDIKTYSSSEIKPQQLDQSKLVPLLVKTIQELEARLTAGGL